MEITWFGHSAYRLAFGNAVVLIDPFFTGNPAFAGDAAAASVGVTHILLTHGHSDHVGDTVAIARQTGATLVGNFELVTWLARQGLERIEPMNTGGSVDLGDFTASLTIAFHSSAQMDDASVSHALGLPNGVVVTPKQPKEPTVYHMGDTDIFSDMALIAEIYAPDVVMVPIGDRFTMGPRLAAMAVQRFLPRVKTVLPCHFGSFPPLVQTPDAFIAALGHDGGKVRVPKRGAAFSIQK